MWQVLLLCLPMFAPQVGQPTGDGRLMVSNVRPTLCPFGPPRTDTTYLPTDVVHVTFDVSGLKLDAEGRYRATARLVVEDAAGKAVASEDYGATPPRLGVLAGGSTRFSFHYLIPPDAPAGSYKAKLQLTDLVARQEQAKTKDALPAADPNRQVTVEQAFKVTAPSFGLVRFVCGRGAFGQAETPCIGAVGEVLFLGATAVGLGKGKEGNGHVEVRVEVHDAQGRILGKPQTSDFKDLSAGEPLLLKFELPLDRAGKFQVVFRATDKASSPTRSATLTIPVTVVD